MLFLNASFNKTAPVRYILYRHAWWWEVRKTAKKKQTSFFLSFSGSSGMMARKTVSSN